MWPTEDDGMRRVCGPPGTQPYLWPRPLAPTPDRFQLGDLDGAREAVDLPLLEPSSADLESRSRAGRDRRTERILRRLAFQVRGEVGRQQDVARPDDRDRLDGRRPCPVAVNDPLLTEQRPATGLLRDQDVAGTLLGDRAEPEDEVLVLVELLADEPLRLVLVRRDEERLGLGAEPQRLPCRVEHGEDPAPVELADRLPVEALVDVARQRARENDGLCVLSGVGVLGRA